MSPFSPFKSLLIPRGVLKFGFGRDVPMQNLKADTESTNTNFSRKSDPCIYQSAQFWAKSPNLSKIFLNLSQFWLKFGKNLKINPFIYQILHFIRGRSYTKRLILLPMLGANPCKVFCTEYHPRLIPHHRQHIYSWVNMHNDSHRRCHHFWRNRWDPPPPLRLIPHHRQHICS